jgi:uncharacterized protein
VADVVRRPDSPRSAFYAGWVVHRRLEPVAHSFRYPVMIPLLYLDELPRLLDAHPLWSARRPAPARVSESDLLGGEAVPAADAARDLVARQLGLGLEGPVAVLAHPRYLGIGFNPLRVYFTFGPDERAAAAVAEVTNTPWGERYAYPFGLTGTGDEIGGIVDKRMRVSPFMPLDQQYDCRITQPGERLNVVIRNLEGGRAVFEATLALRRLGFSAKLLTQAVVAHPPHNASTLRRIYWQALKLRLKGVRRRDRESSRSSGAAGPPSKPRSSLA